MTNIEAIKYLEYLQDNYTRKGAPMCQAIDTAIAALKPKPIQTNADSIRQMTDEEPVRHGRWLNRKRNGYAVLVCSECEREKEGYTRTAYCPHCCARMDGGSP